MIAFEVVEDGVNGLGAQCVPDPRYKGLQSAFACVLPDGADVAFADKPGRCPGAVSDKVKTAPDGLQAVVADF